MIIRKISIKENEIDREIKCILSELIALSSEWADEKLCPGYYANDESEYFDKELYIAEADGKIVGYLLGHIKELEEETSYNSIGEKAFEIDELYVTKPCRAKGIGGSLFRFAENDMSDNVDLIGLTAATNEHGKLLSFYINDMSMKFNHALLIKRMDEAKENAETTENAEIWDAYDRYMNRVDGVSLIRGKPIENGLYHIVCEIAVRHEDGSYLLMKRHPDKPLGNRWEISAGGSVLAGETPLDGAKRELFEETGIKNAHFTELGRLIHHRHNSIYVQFLAKTSCEKDCITLQEGETVGFKWMSAQEITALKKQDLATVRIQSFIDELRE